MSNSLSTRCVARKPKTLSVWYASERLPVRHDSAKPTNNVSTHTTVMIRTAEEMSRELSKGRYAIRVPMQLAMNEVFGRMLSWKCSARIPILYAVHGHRRATRQQSCRSPYRFIDGDWNSLACFSLLDTHCTLLKDHKAIGHAESAIGFCPFHIKHLSPSTAS